VAPQQRSSEPRMSDADIEELYGRYREELQRFFLGQTRNAQAVEELMQELYKCLLEYHPPAVLSKPQGYLWRVAWSVLHEANERAQRHLPGASCDPVTLDQFAAEQHGNLWFPDSATDLETLETLERALSRLPRTDRTAIYLHKGEGWTYKEIAMRMGVSSHAVKKYIGRGLRQLHNHSRRAPPRKSTSGD
jgi:RNA polymerase sigma factor (sigma-70 family)